MASGRELPPAGGVPAEKKTHLLIFAVAVTVAIVLLFGSTIFLIVSLSSFSLPWIGGNSDTGADANQPEITKPAVESDYTGTWRYRTPEGKGHVIMFTSDNRFKHWISDSDTMNVYNGSWRYDSSLYVYRMIYDSGDYSASVRINPVPDGVIVTMHFEPLSSAHGMPLKGFDLEKVELAATAS